MSRISKILASTIKDDDIDQYGPDNLIKTDDDGCWASESADGHYLYIELDKPLTSDSSMKILFQGGFVPKLVDIYHVPDPIIDLTEDCLDPITLDELIMDSKLFYLDTWVPLDNNHLQECHSSGMQSTPGNFLFFLRGSYDPYGRIIIYKIIFG